MQVIDITPSDVVGLNTYRKINDLTEAGLLNKLIRINPVGRHEYEYELGVDQMTSLSRVQIIQIRDCRR